MDRHFLIAVHVHADGMGTARYHGIHQDAPEWPPAPARVYQAMVAGVARGSTLPDAFVPALRWLECLQPPLILAPHRVAGQRVSQYVPNNDADALTDPSDVSDIRVAKRVEPSLFDASRPLIYAWPLPEGDVPHAALEEIAHGLYQLGRGVDMAWADARVLSDDELQSLVRAHDGVVHRPAVDASIRPLLACPMPGSLDSLVVRHRSPRLRATGAGRDRRVLFSNAPKPGFRSISYAPTVRSVLYELRERGTTHMWPCALHRASSLVEQVRDAAAARLRAEIPEASESIERCLVGRAPDGSGSVPIARRVRILPLPSIGSSHVDRAIRRLLVEVPGDCPLRADDLEWAFSGLERLDADTGEVGPWVLVRAEQTDMRSYYVDPSRHWQSITPVAVPADAARRRLDPARLAGDDKGAAERDAEEVRAALAVRQALRQARVAAEAVQVRVQREPFAARGQRAERFAQGTRFGKERLWHVSITFDRAVPGPLAIGDGRFVGLGVLASTAPASGFATDPGAWTGERTDGVVALQVIEPDDRAPGEPLLLARALRRAVMARVRDTAGPTSARALDPFFSGHADGRDGPDDHPMRHLAYHWDPPRKRWLLLAPHRLQRRPTFPRERQHLARLDRAVEGLVALTAGQAGRFRLRRGTLSPDDPMIATTAVWESVTPYVVNRHRRTGSATDALTADVIAECIRCHLPAPRVIVLEWAGGKAWPCRGACG
jgi:CRISPR-associated protein Csb2